MLKRKCKYPNIRKFIIDNKGTYDFDKVLHIVGLIDDDKSSDKDILDALDEFLPSVYETFKFRVGLEETVKKVINDRFSS